MKKAIQRTRILDLLRSYNGGVCPLNVILNMSPKISQYGTRIKELRDRGYVIKNVPLGTVNGEKHTGFRLVSEPITHTEAIRNEGLVRELNKRAERLPFETPQGQLQLFG